MLLQLSVNTMPRITLKEAERIVVGRLTHDEGIFSLSFDKKYIGTCKGMLFDKDRRNYNHVVEQAETMLNATRQALYRNFGQLQGRYIISPDINPSRSTPLLRIYNENGVLKYTFKYDNETEKAELL